MLRKDCEKNIKWEKSTDVKNRVEKLIKVLNFNWIKTANLHFVKSKNANTQAYARIWGLPKLWQLILKEKPNYIIEVISEKFDKLSEKEKDRVLIHELAHIPKNFSGSLLSHIKKKGKRNFNDKVNKYIKMYFKQKKF